MKAMKIIKVLLIAIIAISFASCSNNDEPNQTEQEKSIVGTWVHGNYFVSFSEDGFYSAYIDNEFIDSGDYIRKSNNIICNNNYFNRETKYTVNDISENALNMSVSYVDLYGDDKTKNITFTKSDDKITLRSNTLSGKSTTWLSSAAFGYITMSFNTSNSGMKSATKGSAARYPLNFFYIYVGNRMYYQILDNASVQVPTIGGWTTDYNTVHCWDIHISPNGSIDGFDVIELSSN